jgi:hypothetical protein
LRPFADEVLQPSSDERFCRAVGPPRDAQVLDAALQNISRSISERNLPAILGELTKPVPEYQPGETLLALFDPSLA